MAEERQVEVVDIIEILVRDEALGQATNHDNEQLIEEIDEERIVGPAEQYTPGKAPSAECKGGETTKGNEDASGGLISHEQPAASPVLTVGTTLVEEFYPVDEERYLCAIFE